jgi:hypothetical protein
VPILLDAICVYHVKRSNFCTVAAKTEKELASFAGFPYIFLEF